MSCWRALAYFWAAPSSALGLLLVATAGARVRVREGVLEAHGPGIAKSFDVLPSTRPIAAMTLGHVVVARDLDALESTRAHERIHVHQYERWGPFFVPAYACASVIAWIRRGDAYRDNVFERQARQRAGELAPADLRI